MQDNERVVIYLTLMMLFLVSIFCTLNYVTLKMKISNFQTVVADLSEEQRCLHICGFQYKEPSFFEQYKFCVENCDKISEREHKCGLGDEK